MRSLSEQIADDAADVFLNTEDFARVMRHYPSGDLGGPSHNVTGVLTVDQEQSGGNLDGDGSNPSSERGVTVRHSAILELPIDEEVNQEQGMTPPSLFTIDYLDSAGNIAFTEHWHAVRPLGHDESMQSYAVAFVHKHVTRRATRT
jgi:hypothetical protein